MTCVANAEIQRRLVQVVGEKNPRPTQLLELLKQEDVSYQQIQDALSELLNSGAIQLGSDRRLSIPNHSAVA